MRHKVSGNRLNRGAAHRKALLRNLSDSLILNESIVTTVAKAKALRSYIEKLITRAKKDTGFASINLVESKLTTKKAAKKLFKEIAPRFADRAGGYTRITRTGERDGDKASLAKIEFVSK